MSNKKFIEIGLFVGVHGIKGEVKLKSYTQVPENIFLYEKLFIESFYLPIDLIFVRKTKQNIICKIENVKTRNDAEKFKALKLFVTRDSLPKLTNDEFYQSDLLGFQIYNLKRESFGLIVSFNEFGGGLLAEVKNFNKIFYLPMGKNFLEQIDYEKKEVILNLDINFIKD